MNPERARLRLVTWRPPSPHRQDPDPNPDPELASALRQAEQDPALAAWFRGHQAFQQGVRDRLRSLPVPADLADRLRGLPAQAAASSRSAPAVARPRFGGTRLAYAAAALFLAALGITTWISRPRGEAPGFAVFRDRMVRAAIREYRMDLETPDLTAIRSHLRGHQAPADFELPPALAAATAVGGGVLSWQGNPVSMVCLRTPETGMLYLFVVEAPFNDAPARPELARLSRLAMASWTAEHRTFVLAAETTEEILRRFIPASAPVRGDLSPGRHPQAGAAESESVPACRLGAHRHGRPQQQPVVIGAFVVSQFDG